MSGDGCLGGVRWRAEPNARQRPGFRTRAVSSVWSGNSFHLRKGSTAANSPGFPGSWIRLGFLNPGHRSARGIVRRHFFLLVWMRWVSVVDLWVFAYPPVTNRPLTELRLTVFVGPLVAIMASIALDHSSVAHRYTTILTPQVSCVPIHKSKRERRKWRHTVCRRVGNVCEITQSQDP